MVIPERESQKIALLLFFRLITASHWTYLFPGSYFLLFNRHAKPSKNAI